jgi:hypothetical protein
MKSLRLHLASLAILACVAFAPHRAVAQPPFVLYCINATSTPCITGSQVGTGTEGDEGWLFSGKINADFAALPPQLFVGTLTFPSAATTVAGLQIAETWASLQKFTNSDIALLGSSTGFTTFTSANASATNFTITVPAITDTLVTLTATQTLTNKSIAGSEINSSLVGVPFGGTGAVTLTGPIKGNGTSAFTAAAASDIYGLFGCAGVSTTFLNGAGGCTTPSGGGNVSNTGTPTSGQIAEWTSSTVIGGQTLGGDCTLSTATLTCLKTNGVTLTALATTVPGTGIATFLATPSSANFAAAVTGESGTGALLFGTSPSITSPTIATGETLSFVTGSTQCLHVSTSGVVSGTGSDCGSSGGSGTVNSGTSGQLAIYASTGTAVSGATIGAGLSLTGSTLASSYSIRVVSGTTDTILSTDCANGVEYTSSSAVAITLPQATGSFATCNVDIVNTGTGTDTVTPATSTVNGGTSVAVSSSRNANITASSGNYVATGTYTVSGTGGTVTTTGSPTSGQLAMFSGATSVTGITIASTMTAFLEANTTFTIAPTGCTPSAHTGGPFGGTITLAAGPCTSIVVTMNGATGYTAAHGFDCSVGDQTAQAAGTWVPRWGQTASSTTTATIPIPAAAGSTDVISFNCAPN